MPYLIIRHVLIPCYPLSLKVANVIPNVNNVICLPFWANYIPKHTFLVNIWHNSISLTLCFYIDMGENFDLQCVKQREILGNFVLILRLVTTYIDSSV